MLAKLQQFDEFSYSKIVFDTQKLEKTNIIVATPGSFRKYSNLLDLSNVKTIIFDDFEEIIENEQLYNSIVLMFNRNIPKKITCGCFTSKNTIKGNIFLKKFIPDFKIITEIR